MTIVAEILDCMSGIPKPQRKFLLTLFVSMLITRTRLNFLNLSRHSSLNEKTFRRQFRKAFDFGGFNRSTIERAVPVEHTQVFAQDASFSTKSGQHTYGIDHFWNGSASRVEKGLEVSLISIVDVAANQSFALVRRSASSSASSSIPPSSTSCHQASPISMTRAFPSSAIARTPSARLQSPLRRALAR